MEILIRGDYLVFCIGNIISDATIAIFAFFIWYRQQKENKIKIFIDLLRIQGLKEIDFLTLNTALELSDKSYLNKVKLSEPDKNKLSGYLDFLRLFNSLYYILLPSFALGVFIQFLAIAIGRWW
jgi:hypothetical protein